MPLDALRSGKDQSARWLGFALAAWAVCLLAILVRLALVEPGRGSLYPVYRVAAQSWRAGQDLYPIEPKDIGFPLYRYSPAAAVLMAPLSYLPFGVGDLLWRIVNAGALLAGLLWWSRAVRGLANVETVGAFLLLVLPLAIGNLNNGQTNSLVLAALLAGLAAVAGERWNLAAGLIALASIFKVYPIAVGLLVGLLYPRRFPLRLAGALVLGLGLPFLLHDSAYVLRQYALWLNYMRMEDRSTWPVYFTNLDFQMLCRAWVTPISPRTYCIIQLIAAAIIGSLCLAARRLGWQTGRLLTLVLGLGCVWMTVFGPATESPTYVLLAPSAAGALLSSWRDRRSSALCGVLLSAYALLVSAQAVSWFAGLYLPYRALGPQPFAGLLLAVGLLVQLFHLVPEARGQRLNSAVSRFREVLSSEF
jgi:hypothetical protein